MLRTAPILGLVLLIAALPGCDRSEPKPLDDWYEQTSREAIRDLMDRVYTLRDTLSTQTQDPELLALHERLDDAERELVHVSVHRTAHPQFSARLVAIEDELNEIEYAIYDGPETWVRSGANLEAIPH